MLNFFLTDIMLCLEAECWARASTKRAATCWGSASARSSWPTSPSGSLSDREPRAPQLVLLLHADVFAQLINHARTCTAREAATAL
eukprot:3389485-Heterocapsa_arctica.AAC.1